MKKPVTHRSSCFCSAAGERERARPRPAVPHHRASKTVFFPPVAAPLLTVVFAAIFLKEVVRQLGLRDTEVLNCRYEELVARPETHEVADVVTVRGVRVDSRMLQVLRTLVREGGAVFLFRGATEQVFPPEACLSLKYLGTYPLVDSLKSQVTVLKKTIGE